MRFCILGSGSSGNCALLANRGCARAGRRWIFGAEIDSPARRRRRVPRSASTRFSSPTSTATTQPAIDGLNKFPHIQVFANAATARAVQIELGAPARLADFRNRRALSLSRSRRREFFRAARCAGAGRLSFHQRSRRRSFFAAPLARVVDRPRPRAPARPRTYPRMRRRGRRSQPLPRSAQGRHASVRGRPSSASADATAICRTRAPASCSQPSPARAGGIFISPT